MPNTPDQLHEQYFGHEHVTIIEPTKGWRPLDLKELWAYRELLWVLMQRDLKVRYRQAALGALWAVLTPLMLMTIYSLLLGRLAKVPSDGYPYPILVFSSLVGWSYFSSLFNASCSSLTGSAHLISKVYFPRLIIPLSSIGATFVDFLMGLLVLALLMLFYGIGVSWNLLILPLLLLGVTLCALGIGTAFAAMNVTYRDFQHLVPLVMQVWFFATPVIYPSSLTSTSSWGWILQLNPLYGLMEGFRSAFLGREIVWPSIAYGLTVSLLLFCVGVAVFERAERRFADVI